MRKTFSESMRETYYRRTIIYSAVMVTLIFVTEVAEVVLGAC